MTRAHNFNPGPAVLPVSVLERTKEALLDLNGSGVGLLETSHRGVVFETLLEATKERIRRVASIGTDYEILFCTGGATQQFSMVPMNLLPEGKTANYIVTGSWSEKARDEARKFGKAVEAASTKASRYTTLPTEYQVTEDGAYVYYTSNETISGVQFPEEPPVGEGLLVCDASSDIFSRQITVSKYGVLFAGAQKNLGPAGVTLVIIRKDLLDRGPASLPLLMRYKSYSDSNSLYNTPPVFAIYVVGEVMRWMEEEGGLGVIEERNRKKAALAYGAIDRNPDLYRAVTQGRARSLMNATFTLPSPDLERRFLVEAEKRGLLGLQGHKSFGGIRISMYNSLPVESVEELTRFMGEFEKEAA